MNASCIQNQQRGSTPAISDVGCAGERPPIEPRKVAEHKPASAVPKTAPTEDDPVVPAHSQRLRTMALVAQSTVVEAPEVADTKAWDWVTVRTTGGFRASQGKHAVEMEVTPVGVGRRRIVGDARRSNNADRTSLRCGIEHARWTLTLLLSCEIVDVSVIPTYIDFDAVTCINSVCDIFLVLKLIFIFNRVLQCLLPFIT